MTDIDLTVCVAIDAKTIEFLRVSWPTWKKFREEMWDMPWLCIWDRDSFRHNEPVTLLHDEMQLQDQVKFVAWPPDVPGLPMPHYENQREKMLTSWVYVPALHVKTDWWMKIDADALATARTDWLNPEWFEPETHEIPRFQYNCWIASPWSYTKPADQMDKLDKWGDIAPQLRECPRLDLPYDPNSNKCNHKRMASWLSYYRTEWTRMVVEEILVPSVEPLKLPVPSQDGFHWYVAERGGFRYLRANQKRRSWGNKAGLDALKERVAEALKEKGEEQPGLSDPAALPEGLPLPLSTARSVDCTPKKPETLPPSLSIREKGTDLSEKKPEVVINRSMHDKKPFVPPAPLRATGSKGVLYLNVGAKHGLNLLVSIMSLREFYDGPVVIACGDPLANQIGEALCGDQRLGPIDLVLFTYEKSKRGSIYAAKCSMNEYSPFDSTVFLDCDTLVVGDFSDLFPEPDFITLTQFADWASNGHVRHRILEWKDVDPEDVALMAGNRYPAINTGVIGFSKTSRFFKEWKELTLKKICFICDEIAAQLIFYKYPCRVADDRYNASPVHSSFTRRPSNPNADTRIWHGHGNKFIRAENENWLGPSLWMPWYEQAIAGNYGNVESWKQHVDKKRLPETYMADWPEGILAHAAV